MKVLKRLRNDFPIYKIDIDESGQIILDNKNTYIKITKIDEDFTGKLLEELEEELYKCLYNSIEIYIKN
jgi:nitrogen regulatory protein PII-like uncharacterized protein